MPSVSHSRALGANGANLSSTGSAVGTTVQALGGLKKRLSPACRGPWSERDWARGAPEPWRVHRGRLPFSMTPVHLSGEGKCQLGYNSDTTRKSNHECQPGHKLPACVLGSIAQAGELEDAHN